MEFCGFMQKGEFLQWVRQIRGNHQDRLKHEYTTGITI